MTKYTSKQLNIIGLNLSLILRFAKKTQQNLADEMGKSRQAVSAWVTGSRMKSQSLTELTQVLSRWLGVQIKSDDILSQGFSETLISSFNSTGIVHDLSYARAPLSVEEYIQKNMKLDNLDEHDEAFLRSIYSRGSKLDNVPESSIRNILLSFRENAKEQWISGSK